MTVAEMTYQFSRAQYDQMVEAGVLEGEHVELIDGEILPMSPIYNPHVTACTLLTELLRVAFGPGVHIRVQAPLAFGSSEPQPDIAVISGSPRDYDYHPSTALLVVEIADMSLRTDRLVKTSLYASAGIRDYWILNLRAGQLEIHRSPKRDRAQRFGYRYADVQIAKRKESATPLKSAQGGADSGGGYAAVKLM